MNIKSITKIVAASSILLFSQSLMTVSSVHAEEVTSQPWTLADYHGASASVATLPWKSVEVSEATNLGIAINMSSFLEDTDLDHVIGFVSSGDVQIDATFKYIDKDKKIVGLSVDMSQLKVEEEYGIIIYNPYTFVRLKYQEQPAKQIDNKVFNFYTYDKNTSYDPMLSFSVMAATEQAISDDVNVQWIKYDWTDKPNDLGMALSVQKNGETVDQQDVTITLTDSQGHQISADVSTFNDKEYGALFAIHLDKNQLAIDEKYQLALQYQEQTYPIPNQYFDKKVQLANNIMITTENDELFLIKSSDKVEQGIVEKIINTIMPSETKDVKSQSDVKEDNKVMAKTQNKTLPATGMTTGYTTTIGVGLLLIVIGFVSRQRIKNK